MTYTAKMKFNDDRACVLLNEVEIARHQGYGWIRVSIGDIFDLLDDRPLVRDEHFARHIRKEIAAVKREARQYGWKSESLEGSRAEGKLEGLLAALEFIDPHARDIDVMI